MDAKQKNIESEKFRFSSKAEMRPSIFWVGCVVAIYAYLYACMFLGAPFIAYDHLNYINFLKEPIPLFYEPIYTGIAYLLAYLPFEDLRFPLIFLIFTAPPFWLVLRSDRLAKNSARGMILYACILIKSFYIGYISQRFFFVELWVSALLIYYSQGFIKRTPIIPGLIHFSALSIIPSVFWLRGKKNILVILGAILLFVSLTIYLRYFSDLMFFGYTYQRYLDSEKARSFPFMSVIQMSVLALLCWVTIYKRWRTSYMMLIIAVTSFKIIFSDFEVFSRIFQIQTDLIIVTAGLVAYRYIKLFFVYCLGFFILQLFFTPTAAEVGEIHSTSIINIFNYFF